MTEIFGQNFIDSLEDTDLSQSLASKLQAKTERLGSTMYALTWKETTTDSGHVLPRLVASVRRKRGQKTIPDTFCGESCDPVSGLIC